MKLYIIFRVDLDGDGYIVLDYETASLDLERLKTHPSVSGPVKRNIFIGTENDWEKMTSFQKEKYDKLILITDLW